MVRLALLMQLKGIPTITRELASHALSRPAVPVTSVATPSAPGAAGATASAHPAAC